MKTISMFLRASKTEAEEAGIETDGMAESVSKLRAEIQSLSGVDIMLPDGSTYKSTIEILRELAKVWETLSDVSQANIAERLAGKRQSNVLFSLMSNFETAESVLTTVSDSNNSALEENEKYLNSINGAIVQLQSTFESFSNNVLSSDIVTGAIKFFSGILNALNEMPSAIGAVTVAVSALIAQFSGLGFGANGKTITLLGNDLFALGNKADGAGNKIKGFVASIKEFFAQTTLKKSIEEATNSMNNNIALLESWNNELNKTGNIEAAFAEKFEGASGQVRNVGQELILYKGNVDEASKAINAYKQKQLESIDAAEQQTLEYKKASFQAKAAAVAASIAIAAAITVVSQLFISLFNSTQHAVEEADKLSQKFSETKEELNSMKSSMSDLAEKYNQLSRGVNKLGENVSLSTEEYQEYQNVVSEIIELSPSLIQGYNDEGDAIIKTTNLVSDLADEYERAAEAAGYVAGSNFGALFSGYATKTMSSGWLEALGFGSNGTTLSEKIGDLTDLYNVISDINNINPSNLGSFYDSFVEYTPKALQEVLNELKIQPSDLYGAVSNYVNGDLTREEEAIIEQYLQTIKQKLITLTEELSVEDQNIAQSILDYIVVDDKYKQLDDDAKSLVNSIITQLDNAFYSGANSMDGNVIKTYISDNIIDAISLMESQGNDIGAAFVDMLEAQINYSEGKLSGEDFIEMWNKFVPKLDKVPTATKPYLYKIFGIDSEGDGLNQAEKLISDVTQMFVDEIGSGYEAALQKLQDNYGDGVYMDKNVYIETYQPQIDEFKKWLATLKIDEIQLVPRLIGNVDTFATIDEWIAHLSNIVKEVKAAITFSLSDSEKEIDNFQEVIKKVSDALNSVRKGDFGSTDIVDLMQEFPTFKWENFNITGQEGVGDFEAALTSLIDEEYAAIKSSLELSGASEQLIDSMLQSAEAAKKEEKSFETALSSHNALQSAFDKIKQGTSLTVDEVTELVEVCKNDYPEITKAFTKTADGYTISADTIIAANDNIVKSAKESTEKQIEYYQKLIEALPKPNSQGDYAQYNKLFGDYSSEIESLQLILELLTDITEVTFGTDTTSADFKNAMRMPEYLHSTNQMSDEEYYENLTYYNDIFFKGVADHEDEYYSNLATIYNWQKQEEEDLYNKKIENYDKLAAKSLEQYDYAGAISAYTSAITETQNHINQLVLSGTENIDDELASLTEKIVDLNKQIQEAEQQQYERKAERLTQQAEKALEYETPYGEIEESPYAKFDKARHYYERAIEKAKERISELYASGEGTAEQFEALNKSVLEYNEAIDEINKQELDARIENEIAYWENQKSIVEDIYDAQIEALEKENEVLDKRNDKEQKRLNILEAEAELEKARNNRNRLVFENGGFEYKVDEEAIKSATKNVASAKDDYRDAERQEQIDAINDEKSATIAVYDEIIRLINLYKNGAPPAESDSELLNLILNSESVSAESKDKIVDNLYDVISDATALGGSITPDDVLKLLLKGTNVTDKQLADMLTGAGFVNQSTSNVPTASEIAANSIVNNVNSQTITYSFGDINVAISGNTSQAMLDEFADQAYTSFQNKIAQETYKK